MRIIIANISVGHLCNRFPLKCHVLWFIYPKQICYLNEVSVCMCVCSYLCEFLQECVCICIPVCGVRYFI